jgi:hypothetical protein
MIRLKNFNFVLLAFGILFITNGCKRTVEEFNTLTISELIPLKIGKYITYRVDSLVFINNGKSETIRRYQMKHVVEWQSSDNLNRPSWRVKI